MKNRLTNYNFWISIISAVLLILQAFNIEFDIAYFNEIATAVLGLLVVIGIVSDPTKISIKSDSQTSATSVVKTIQSNEESSKETQISAEKEIEDNGVLDAIPSATKDEVASNAIQDDYKTFVDKIEQDLQDSKESISMLKTELFEALKSAISSVGQTKNVNEEKVIENANSTQPTDNTNIIPADTTNSFNIVNQ